MKTKQQKPTNKHFVGRVVSNTKIARDTVRIRVQLDWMPEIIAGQFLNVKLRGETRILRRPFAICDWDAQNKTVDFGVFIKGDGTRELSKLSAGDSIDVLMPLGNGFPTMASSKKVMIIAGGIGAFPMLSVAKTNKTSFAFVGFRSSDHAILLNDFKQYSTELHIATDDGSLGEKNFCTVLAKQAIQQIKPDVIFACGPDAMFHSMQKAFADVWDKIPVYISMEQRMACGFGACICCNQAVQVNGEVENLRVCCEGPVFLLKEVVL